MLVTEEMVKGMAPGSVIVDLAARAGRQLRTDAGRRNHRRSTASPSSARFNVASTACPTTRARCTRATSPHFCSTYGEGRKLQLDLRRRDHPRDLAHARRWKVVNARVREFFRCPAPVPAARGMLGRRDEDGFLLINGLLRLHARPPSSASR